MIVENSNNRDQVLTDIRTGRRLQNVVSSIDSFLGVQVDKIEQLMLQSEKAQAYEQRLQQRALEFEKEKREWEQERKAEIERLSAASEKLAKGWEQLETQRREFLETQS